MQLQGPYIKNVRSQGGGVGPKKADIVRGRLRGFTTRDQSKIRTRGEGVQNPENFADVLYAWSHSSQHDIEVKFDVLVDDQDLDTIR